MKKKVTKRKKLIHKVETGTTVQNCIFTGAYFNGEAIETINMIADGLIKNAEAIQTNAQALLSLTDVLKPSSLNIETMIQIGGD